MAKKEKKAKQQEIDHASTQEHIPIATVRDGVLVMKDGGMRAVLLVNALNFSLKSAEEQNSIIYQYQSFLNSLNFPIQILVQSRIMDLGIYLKNMQDSMRRQTNELLLDVTESYIDFVESLIEKSNIMTKRFYVIVPIQPINTGLPTEKTKGLFKKKKSIEVKYSDKDFAHYRQELNDKLSVVAAGLSSIGLQAIQLDTQQVIELFYTTYNPEEAITEKLTNVEDLEGDIVLENPQLAQEQKQTATGVEPAVQDSFGKDTPTDAAAINNGPATPVVPSAPNSTSQPAPIAPNAPNNNTQTTTPPSTATTPIAPAANTPSTNQEAPTTPIASATPIPTTPPPTAPQPPAPETNTPAPTPDIASVPSDAAATDNTDQTAPPAPTPEAPQPSPPNQQG